MQRRDQMILIIQYLRMHSFKLECIFFPEIRSVFTEFERVEASHNTLLMFFCLYLFLTINRCVLISQMAWKVNIIVFRCYFNRFPFIRKSHIGVVTLCLFSTSNFRFSSAGTIDWIIMNRTNRQNHKVNIFAAEKKMFI